MRLFFSLLSISVLCFSCTQEQKTNNTIDITNALGKDRTDVPIIIKRKKVASIVQNNTSFKLTNKGQEIAYQLDDTNADNEWDEIAFVLNLKANETTSISFDTISSPSTFKQRAHARLGYSETRNNTFVTIKEHTRPTDHLPQSKPWLYQFEGPGWENDKVAFRAYFDNRNGKDIFGKTVNEMVIDTIGLPIGSEAGSYHHLLPWGMDVLKVGSSLGAGAIGFLTEDSLYRLENTTTASYKLISDGPIRAVIELSYDGWMIEGSAHQLTETITIWAGQYAYQSNVSISPLPTGNLVTGIVTMKLDTLPVTTNTNTYSAALTFGKQSENHDELGMAIITSAKDFNRFENSDSLNSSVKSTILTVFNDTPTYWFIAGWGLSNDAFKTHQGFSTYIEDFAQETQNTIIIE